MDRADQTTLTFAYAMRSPRALSLEQPFGRDVAERCGVVAQRAGAPPPRFTPFNGTGTIAPLTPRGLLVALDLCAQRQDLVCGAWVTPPTNPRHAGGRVMVRARGTTVGFAMGPEPAMGADPAAHERSAAVGALLTLHMAVARARTPAQWAALVAVGRSGTTIEAARALEISHQAVSKARRRANGHATAGTWLALVALLDSRRRPGETASPADVSRSVELLGLGSQKGRIPGATFSGCKTSR
jgi:hypothetical protein